MRLPRWTYKNAIYHVYNQGVDRQGIFFDEEDHGYWLSLLREITSGKNVQIFCFAAMKNHYHCLLKTLEPNISDVMWFVGYHFARFFNAKYRRVGPLFRNRFQSQIIEDPDYFQNVVRYIHCNPVLGGFINRIDEECTETITSYRYLTGQSKEYKWLAKTELFWHLGIHDVQDPLRVSLALGDPVTKETFASLTKTERKKIQALRLLQAA